MKTFIQSVIVFTLVMTSIMGFAYYDQHKQFPTTEGKLSASYVTTYAPTIRVMKAVGNKFPADPFYGCQFLTAEQLVQKEHLVPNKNFTGGWACSKSGNQIPEIYVVLKSLEN